MDAKSLIVVVSYNSENFIENCLKSVLKQNYKSWILVVVDNNSKDETVDRIREFRNSHINLTTGNFKLITLKKNIGFSAAVNYAVFKFISKKKKELEKKLEYLVLINPDICLSESALENLILPLEAEGKNIGVAGGLILDYKKDTIQHLGGKVGPNYITSHIGYGRQYRDLDGPQKVMQGIEKSKAPGETDYVTGALFATKFSIFKKIGGFDTGYRPAYYEELDYCIKIKRSGRKVAVNPCSIARHFEGASVKKFSRKFYKYYHKNRIRCAVINMSFFNFLGKFIKEEFRWVSSKATKDQLLPLMYAYFLNFIFLPCNLAVKVKNYLAISRLRLKDINSG